jgi:hypothetical protein
VEVADHHEVRALGPSRLDQRLQDAFVGHAVVRVQLAELLQAQPALRSRAVAEDGFLLLRRAVPGEGQDLVAETEEALGLAQVRHARTELEPHVVDEERPEPGPRPRHGIDQRRRRPALTCRSSGRYGRWTPAVFCASCIL